MAKDKKNKKSTEACAGKAELNLNSSEVNKKPQKNESKGSKENKLNETVTSKGKDKNISAVPVKESEKKKQQKKQNGLKTDDNNTQNHKEENLKTKKHKYCEENGTGEPVKNKKKQKLQKEETTTTPKSGQSSASPAVKENGKKKKHNSGEKVTDGSTGDEPVKKKKKQKLQKEELTPTPKTRQSNALPALKVENGKKKHNSRENVADGSAGDEPVKKKKKQKHQKEESTPTPKAASPALKENGKKKKPKSGENVTGGSAGDGKKETTKPKGGQSSDSPASKVRKPRHPGREERKLLKAQQKVEGTSEAKVIEKKKRKRANKKGLKSDKPKDVMSGEDDATAEEKAKQYLNLWHTNKAEWSFIKARQNWLVHNMYDPEKIPDATFKTLLKYLAGMKGHSREETKKQAQSMLDAVTKDKNVLHKKLKLSDDPGPVQQARADQVIQIL